MGSPERPLPAAIEVLADPQLGHHEREEAVGVVASPARVLAPEPLHLRGLEEAPRGHERGRQEVLQRRP